MLIEKAQFEDLAEILSLQKLAYQSEAAICNDYTIPPLVQTLEGIREDFKKQLILKATSSGKIVGSIRAFEKDGTCYIGKVIVDPDQQNLGLGSSLMHAIEEHFKHCRRFELFTGKNSVKNNYFYQKLGYRIFKEEPQHEQLTLVYLEKNNQS
ncbi:MAG TPA: GNAT family N-acetyltransferase [Bacillota bacterium]|nr:GNAT family N-acetyltransferase [Bacillota bacterium]